MIHNKARQFKVISAYATHDNFYTFATNDKRQIPKYVFFVVALNPTKDIVRYIDHDQRLWPSFIH